MASLRYGSERNSRVCLLTLCAVLLVPSTSQQREDENIN